MDGTVANCPFAGDLGPRTGWVRHPLATGATVGLASRASTAGQAGSGTRQPEARHAGVGKCSVRFARSREEHERAQRLVFNTYCARGYVADGDAWIRYRRLYGLPESRTIIALEVAARPARNAGRGGRIAGTVSLIEDSSIGLPMADAFAEELKALGRPDRRIAEATSLAVRDGHGTRSRGIYFALTRFLIQYACYRGIDDLVVAVHPRHGRFYSKLLGFQPLGRERAYEVVGGHPAVAYRLALDDLGKSNPSLRALHFSPRIPSALFEPRSLRLADHARGSTSLAGGPSTVPWTHRLAS